MIRKIALIVAAAVLLAACSSSKAADDKYRPGTGDVSGLVTREVKVPSFTGVSASGGIRVQYTCAPGRPRVTLRAPEEVINRLSAEVQDGKLVLGFDFGRTRVRTSHNTTGVLVTVSAPALSSIEVSSAATLVLLNDMRTGSDLDIDVSSGARLSWTGNVSAEGRVGLDASSASNLNAGSLRCQRAEVNVSSGAGVKFAGGLTVQSKWELDCSSVGKFISSNIHCGTADLSLSSAGECKVNSLKCESMKAEASSVSKLLMGGECQTVKLVASSGSQVDASSMRSSSVKVWASSTSQVDVPQTEFLSYNQSSGAKVNWQGRPYVRKMED